MPPGATGSGESERLTDRSTCPVWMVVVALAELLLSSRSSWSASTLAVVVRLPVMPESTVTVSETVVLSPLARLPTEQVTVPSSSLHWLVPSVAAPAVVPSVAALHCVVSPDSKPSEKIRQDW